MKKREFAFIVFILYILITCCFNVASGQEDNGSEMPKIDTSMAYSPDFLPTRIGKFPTIHFTPIIYNNIDTSLFYSAEYDPLWSTSKLYQSLGINGQAHKTMIFNTNRPDGFSMIHLPYPLYFRTFDNLKIFDLETSFSNIYVNYGILDEFSFGAIHAQKIRQLKYSFSIDGTTNSGYFLHQKINRINLDAVVRYETPRKIYGFLLAYMYNHGKFEENGGLENISDFTEQNPKNPDDRTLDSYPVMFSNGLSTINSHSGQLTNYLNIKNKDGKYFGTFSHILKFENLKDGFFDYNLNNLFYVNKYYFSIDTTNDSIQYYNLSNTLQFSNYSPTDTISSQPYYFRFAGGIRHEFVNAVSPHYIGNTLTIFGRVSTRLFKVWELYGNMAYSFFGYNKNDATATVGAVFSINKKQKHFIAFEAAFDRYSPDYIYCNYSGNNNLWSNDKIRKQNVLHLDAYWSIFGYKAGFSFYNLGQFAYLNNNFEPIQSEKQIQIVQITGFAPLRIKDFSLDALIALQHSTNEAITVPLFAGKMSVAYHFRVFRRKLDIQLGVDLMYNTKYYADGYNPIMHQFYSQQYIITGNYLYLNAHLALRVKRLSFYVRGGNLIAGLVSYRYITTAGYPMQGRNMELGINWKFYD